YYAKTRYLLEQVGLQFHEVVVFIDVSDTEDEARYYDLHADGHVTRMLDQHPGRGPEFDAASDVRQAVPVPATLAAEGRPSRTIETPPHAAPEAVASDAHPSNRLLLAVTRRSVVLRVAPMLWERWHAATPDYPQGDPRRPLWTVDERDYQAFGRTGLELAAH